MDRWHGVFFVRQGRTQCADVLARHEQVSHADRQKQAGRKPRRLGGPSWNLEEGSGPGELRQRPQRCTAPAQADQGEEAERYGCGSHGLGGGGLVAEEKNPLLSSPVPGLQTGRLGKLHLCGRFNSLACYQCVEGHCRQRVNALACSTALPPGMARGLNPCQALRPARLALRALGLWRGPWAAAASPCRPCSTT